MSEEVMIADIVTFLNYPHETKVDYFINNKQYIEGIKTAVSYVLEGENIFIDPQDEIEYDPRIDEIELNPSDPDVLMDLISMLEMFDVDIQSCGDHIKFKLSEIYEKIC